MDIIASRFGCGCSSVVEHLLAKEDVASSSLVTRSNPGEKFGGRGIRLRSGRSSFTRANNLVLRTIRFPLGSSFAKCSQRENCHLL